MMNPSHNLLFRINIPFEIPAYSTESVPIVSHSNTLGLVFAIVLLVFSVLFEN